MAENRALTWRSLPRPILSTGVRILSKMPRRGTPPRTRKRVVGVEQHLMGLLRIGPENEGAAVGELEVSDLQFGALAADDRPVFRPVELECFTRRERQRHED